MLADYLTLVQNAVRDDGGIIAPADYVTAIGQAVSRYSSDRPQYWVEDIAASGDDSLALPSAWQMGGSTIISLEYPIGRFPPGFVDAEQYLVYRSPSGWALRTAFIATSAVRLTYSITHILDDTTDTIPTAHREAVANWAAANCCEQLASYFANAGDSTIQADRVDRLSQSKDYTGRAKALRARYYNELGVDEKKSAPAGVVVDLDLRDSRNNDRFTHPNRYR